MLYATELDRENLLDLRDRALNWVNSTRSEFNTPKIRKLPTGVKGNGTACVLAMALRSVGESRVETTKLIIGVGVEVHVRAHPEYVRMFLAAFDAGCYPSLEFQPLRIDRFFPRKVVDVSKIPVDVIRFFVNENRKKSQVAVSVVTSETREPALVQ